MGQNQSARAKTIAELAIVAFLALYAILRWLNTFNLPEDGTNYITAALNFVKTGKLFIFVNWPSYSGEPLIEPFTEYPPGMPLFLAPFILIFKEPMLATAVAHSVAVITFYAVVYSFCRSLKLHPLLRLLVLIVFTFFRTFEIIHSKFWSESLFISLSLAIGLVALKLMRSEPKRHLWLMALLLTFLASSVKFIGVANVVWFIPLVFPWNRLARATKRSERELMHFVPLVVFLATAIMTFLFLYFGLTLVHLQNQPARIMVIGLAGVIFLITGILIFLILKKSKEPADDQ